MMAAYEYIEVIDLTQEEEEEPAVSSEGLFDMEEESDISRDEEGSYVFLEDTSDEDPPGESSDDDEDSNWLEDSYNENSLVEAKAEWSAWFKKTQEEAHLLITILNRLREELAEEQAGHPHV